LCSPFLFLERTMRVVTKQIGKSSQGFNDIIDLTRDIESFISDENLSEGQLLIFINGATAAISTVEYEPGLLKDIPRALERIAPMNERYHHNDTWHDGNGYAHVRSTLMSPMVIMPVYKGRLIRGTWQQVILLDFDNRPRQRTITLQFTGI
jgi:secondary thiamine-phosphate synthase enzyme